MSPFNDDDNQPIGRPIQAPLSSPLPLPRADDFETRIPNPTATPDNQIVLDDEPRPDEGLGRPRQAPAAVAIITDADRLRILLEKTREEEMEKRRIEELLASDAVLLRVPAFLVHPLAVSFMVGIAALLGLFVFSQISSTLAALASMNEGLRYTGYVGLTLLTGCVLFAVGRFGVFYFRLQANRPIRLKGLEQLSQRTRLRWLVHEKKREARERLAAYLQAFPLNSDRERKRLECLGLSEEKLLQLAKVRVELLDMNRFASNDDWFSAFRSQFQTVLDEAADARVAYFARRVAIIAAVSPNALVDSLVTTYCGFMMLADLCQIYNLRVGRLGTVVLLGHVFFNAYVAGQLNDFEGVTEAGIQSFWAEIGIHVGSQAVDTYLTGFVSKFGARALSGMLNFYLLKRLGRYASRSLRPVEAE